MIDREEMLRLLLESTPSFQSDWDAFVEEWKNDPHGLPYYVALGDFSRHVIGMLEAGDTASFPALFALIERLHLEGDMSVKEAVVVGILEAFQNTELYDERGPVDMEKYLLPESKRWWAKIKDL